MPNHPIKIPNGAISPGEYARNIQILADLETIRVNQFEIIQEFKTMSSGINTTAQKVKLKPLETGFVYVITSIVGINTTDAAHQVRVGFINGSTDVVLESGTVANIGDSIAFNGQAMLKEGDVIFAEFRSAGANDNLQLNVNGYRIRR